MQQSYMNLLIERKDKQDLWADITDLFGKGPRKRNEKRTWQQIRAVEEQRRRIWRKVGVKYEDAIGTHSSIFAQAERLAEMDKKRSKLSRADRARDEELKQKEMELHARLPRPPKSKGTWLLEAKTRDGTLVIAHKPKGRLRGKAFVRRHGEGSLAVRLESIKEHPTELLGSFCAFLARSLDGEWKAITLAFEN